MPHIRPKKRTPAKVAAVTADTTTTISDGQEEPPVEETRRRMETWVGLQTKQQQQEHPPAPREDNNNDDNNNNNDNKPKSILKIKSKYTSKTAATEIQEHVQSSRTTAPPPVMVQGAVRERPRRSRKKKKSQSKPTEETFVPDTTTNNKSSSSSPADDVLSFNSIADLMQAAGVPLPNNDNTDDSPQVVEAGLEFSCMTPEEFQDFKTQERELQQDIFLGRTTAAAVVKEEEEEEEEEEVNDDKENTTDEDNDDEDEDNDDDLWDFLQGDNNDNNNNNPANDEYYSSEEEVEPVQPRAFLILHNALSQWVTPQAVAYVRHLQQTNYQETLPQEQLVSVPNDDITASRCAGLLALLQMHTQHCLSVLLVLQQQNDDDNDDNNNNNNNNSTKWQIRTADQRLMELIRSCNFAWPAPKLDSKMARALTCILLDTVLGMTTTTTTHDLVVVPEPCRIVGMQVDEYRYLTRSAFVRFESSPDEE